jgi:hypothetical protein
MAFIWVQVWGQLPTLNEFIMGDAPLGSQPTGRNSNMTSRQDSMLPPPSDHYDDNEGRKQRQGTPSQASYPHSQAYPQHQLPTQTRMDPFNMNLLGATLPDISYQNYGQLQPQRYGHGQSSPGLIYHLPNNIKECTLQAKRHPHRIYNLQLRLPASFIKTKGS